MALTGKGIAVEDRTGIGGVRRAAVATAHEMGLDEETVGRAAIVAVELATNTLKHGGGGWCFVSSSDVRGVPAVSVVAADEGEGMSDPTAALADGVSTAGTPGTGLGAVRRLSLSFDVYSRPGGGVIVAAHVGPRPGAGGSSATPSGVPSVEGGGVVRAKPGQQVSGDQWATRRRGRTVMALVADGLGHGVGANEAAEAAVAAFAASRGRTPSAVAGEVDRRLQGTRGAAIAIAHLDPGTRRVRYAGIGNITGRLDWPEGTRHLVSVNGTAGAQARSLREFEYDAPDGGLVVLHSDGLSGRWSLDDYPGLRPRDPGVIAALLLRDFGRARDDAAVLVLRMPSGALPERGGGS